MFNVMSYTFFLRENFIGSPAVTLAVQCQTQAWLDQHRMPHVQKDLQRPVKREDISKLYEAWCFKDESLTKSVIFSELVQGVNLCLALHDLSIKCQIAEYAQFNVMFYTFFLRENFIGPPAVTLAVQCQTQAWLVQRRMPHVQKDLQRAVKREDLILCTSYESQISRVTKPNPQPEGAVVGKCHSNFLIDQNRAAALHFWL